MKIFEAGGDYGTIKAGLVGGEGLHIAKVGEEFSSVDEFKDEIEISGILGESFEGDDEGVVDLRVDKVLVVDVVDLLRLHDFVFVEEFESDILAGLFVLGDLDLAESTCLDLCVPLPSTLPT
jgi:hypothetical protein